MASALICITPLRGVIKQDWNSAYLMIQKPNITLTIKNRGRWIVLSANTKTKNKLIF